MQNFEPNKDERRRILGLLQDWNIGITPVGKLASESCFVHSSVPDILYENNNSFQSSYTFTRSGWTNNLVRSNISNPRDTETMKSLSVCKSIFHPESTSSTEVIHLVQYNIKACVMVNNIARLTKEFEEELNKAEEHWPHSPQKSWDKLCQIWNRYGFLWPQKVEIGFKTHHSFSNNSNLDIEIVKDLLRKESQDISHSPKSYSVIWRTSLMPVHEFFPAQYDTKKVFINNIIRKFSNVMFSDSLIRLKNVKSGDYLCRDTETFEVTTLPSSDNKILNDSNFFWNFDSNESPHYLFNDNKKLLYFGGTTQTTILSKLQYNYFDRNTSQARDNIKLIQYKQLNNQQMPSYDNEDYFQWTLNISNINIENNSFDLFDLDKSIDQVRCLIHGDEISLNQHLFYLKAVSKDSIFKSDSIRNVNSPISQQHRNIKSPSSTFSFGDQYNFSSCESSATQPTSGSNSFHSAGSVPNSKNYRDNTTHQLSNIVFIEKLQDKLNLSPEYYWKIEMVSKSLIEAEHREMINVVKSLSESSISEDQSTLKPYHPDLNYDRSPFASSETKLPFEDKNQNLFTVNDNIYISSFIPEQDHAQSTKQTKTPIWPKKSKWLNVDPKLYNLNKQNEDTMNGSILSAYSASTDSIVSISSPSNSYLPEVSEKRFGKQPLQATSNNYHNNNSSSSSESEWSSSESRSDKNNDIEFNTSIQQGSSILTEAENIKKGYQDSHKKKEINAYNLILQNMFNASPNSNSTSQIRYYDEEDDYGSSHVYTYTMTPYSRYSQQMTPSSSANLTPEEYMRRKKSRENSFMLLIDNETKQEFWLRTVKQSSLSHWLHFLSTNTKKLSNLCQKTIAAKNNNNNNNNNNSDIRLNHGNNNNNRVIQKKKGFYVKKNRKQ